MKKERTWPNWKEWISPKREKRDAIYEAFRSQTERALREHLRQLGLRR